MTDTAQLYLAIEQTRDQVIIGVPILSGGIVYVSQIEMNKAALNKFMIRNIRNCKQSKSSIWP